MYAITCDLDIESLRKNYPTAYNNAYKDIRDFLKENGFSWQQGSVYFGDKEIDAVKCVLVVQKLSKTFEWFKNSVRDIRMLRIEENNDLTPAI